MKNLLYQLVLITSLIVCVSTSAFAQKKTAVTTATTASSASSASSEFGLGVSSFSTSNTSPALTGYFSIGSDNVLQPLFNVTGTAGDFGFSIGALFKHFMSSGTTGWHLGGAFGLGTGSSTAISIANLTATTSNPLTIAFGGVIGVHTTFPGTSNLLIHFDAGPVLTLTDGSANFAISPFSQLLGASLIYVF